MGQMWSTRKVDQDRRVKISKKDKFVKLSVRPNHFHTSVYTQIRLSKIVAGVT